MFRILFKFSLPPTPTHSRCQKALTFFKFHNGVGGADDGCWYEFRCCDPAQVGAKKSFNSVYLWETCIFFPFLIAKAREDFPLSLFRRQSEGRLRTVDEGSYYLHELHGMAVDCGEGAIIAESK